jgi:hypothetical protein
MQAAFILSLLAGGASFAALSNGMWVDQTRHRITVTPSSYQDVSPLLFGVFFEEVIAGSDQPSVLRNTYCSWCLHGPAQAISESQMYRSQHSYAGYHQK